MTKLSDTQAIILSTASQRAGAIALPLPETLKGGAAQKVVGAMLAKGLIEEIGAGCGEPVWRQTDDGYGVTLIATSAGLEAIGVESDACESDAHAAPDTAQGAPDTAEGEEQDAEPPVAEAAPTDAPTAPTAPKPRKTREGTKQAQLIAMPRAEGGGHHRRDRRSPRMASSHSEGRHVRRAQEEARTDHHLREGRGQRAGVQNRQGLNGQAQNSTKPPSCWAAANRSVMAGDRREEPNLTALPL